MSKIISYNRLLGTYSIGNKKVTAKEWWYMAKWLMINKPGCKIQDDRNCLMYEN